MRLAYVKALHLFTPFSLSLSFSFLFLSLHSSWIWIRFLPLGGTRLSLAAIVDGSLDRVVTRVGISHAGNEGESHEARHAKAAFQYSSTGHSWIADARTFYFLDFTLIHRDLLARCCILTNTRRICRE